jgi:hypothetical protein
VSHLLFPPEGEDAAPVVGWVQVARVDRSGTRVFAPRIFAAHELADLEALAAAYGGGTYELYARSPDKSRITARRIYTLPGRPRPLSEEEEPERAPAAALAGLPGLGSGPVDLPNLLLLLDERARARDLEREEREARRASEARATWVALAGALAPVLTQVLGRSGGGEMGQLFPMLAKMMADQQAAPMEAFVAGMTTAGEMAAAAGGLGGGDSDPLSTMARVITERMAREPPPAPRPNGAAAPPAGDS